jgi:hypothetical protein
MNGPIKGTHFENVLDKKSPIPAEERPPRGVDLAKQILSSSGTMIGLCTAMIGLVKVIEVHFGPSDVDIYISLLASLFLGSAVLSYVSIRSARRHRISSHCERGADALFLLGLIILVGVILLFAFEHL